MITLLAGNMVINVLFFAISSAIIFEISHFGNPVLTAAASLLPLLMIVFFGEVVPKALALTKPTAYAALVTPPIYLIQKVTGPVRWILAKFLVLPLVRILAPHQKAETRFVTTEELKLLLARSAKQGAIAPDESALLQEVVELGVLKVKDVMVPRVELVALPINASTSQLIQLVQHAHLTKVPVYRGQIDQIEGLVYAKDAMLAPAKSLSELLRPVQFVPEVKKLDSLLQHFRASKTQLAIVVDEYGGVAGLVTLEDVLEEIVGELSDRDEPVRLEPVQQVGPDEYLIDGRLGLKQWQALFAMGSDPSVRLGVSSVGGLVTSLLGRIPQVGDAICFGNLEFQVESLRGRRIQQLRIKRLAKAAKPRDGHDAS